MKKLKSIIHLWEEYTFDQWFSTFTDAVYRHWRLVSFVWDGVTYTLTYENGSGLLKTISWDGKTYTLHYINWTFRWLTESEDE